MMTSEVSMGFNSNIFANWGDMKLLVQILGLTRIKLKRHSQLDPKMIILRAHASKTRIIFFTASEIKDLRHRAKPLYRNELDLDATVVSNEDLEEEDNHSTRHVIPTDVRNLNCRA